MSEIYLEIEVHIIGPFKAQRKLQSRKFAWGKNPHPPISTIIAEYLGKLNKLD